MAQSAMAGSGPNAQTKPNSNSAVKGQNNGNQKTNANGSASPRSTTPMDVPAAAPISNGGPNNGTSSGIGGESATQNLIHESVLALDWSSEEQSTLEEALTK